MARSDIPAALARRAATGLFQAAGEFPLRVVLWDGSEVGASPAAARWTVRIRDRAALLRLLWDLELAFGDLYAERRVEIEGELIPALAAAYRSGLEWSRARSLLPRRLIDRALRNDLASARRNAQHHYDVGNDFYALFLDERMVYTCAYYPRPDASLEDAQLAKMDHVCRKLALRPGQRVIEAGCGWGALALHMARYYGVTVRAFNVSHEQVAYAREQAEKQGLQDRVEFVEDDYRNVTGHCDAFVSVGMLEHVGPNRYAELGRVIERTLAPDGLGFLHTIGRARPQPLHRWIAQRVFPNAHPPTLGEMMAILEPYDFVTLDVENLRRHYALTCRHWFERLDRSFASARSLVGDHTARTWHLYLAGASAAFEVGSLQLFQLLFSRSDNDRIPWSRRHQYSGGPADLGGQSG